MNFENLPTVLLTPLISLLHGGFTLLAFKFLKNAKSWGRVLVAVVGVSLTSVLMTMFTYLQYGGEQSRDLLLPGGLMFSIVFVPAIMSIVVFNAMIMSAVYIMFVKTGNKSYV